MTTMRIEESVLLSPTLTGIDTTGLDFNDYKVQFNRVLDNFLQYHVCNPDKPTQTDRFITKYRASVGNRKYGTVKSKKQTRVKCPICKYREVETKRGYCVKCDERLGDSNIAPMPVKQYRKSTQYGLRVSYRDIARYYAKSLSGIVPDHDHHEHDNAILAHTLGYRNQRVRTVLDKQTYNTLTNEYERELKRLGKADKVAIKCAFVFSRKVPYDERGDCLAEFYIAIREENVSDIRWAYTIAKRVWKKWWQNYMRHSQYVSLGYLQDYEYAKTDTILDYSREAYEKAVQGHDPVTESFLLAKYDDHWEKLARRREKAELHELDTMFNSFVEFESSVIKKLDTRKLWYALPQYMKDILAKQIYGDEALSVSERKAKSRYIQSHKSWLMAFS